MRHRIDDVREDEDRNRERRLSDKRICQLELENAELKRQLAEFETKVK